MPAFSKPQIISACVAFLLIFSAVTVTVISLSRTNGTTSAEKNSEFVKSDPTNDQEKTTE